MKTLVSFFLLFLLSPSVSAAWSATPSSSSVLPTETFSVTVSGIGLSDCSGGHIYLYNSDYVYMGSPASVNGQSSVTIGGLSYAPSSIETITIYAFCDADFTLSTQTSVTFVAIRFISTVTAVADSISFTVVAGDYSSWCGSSFSLSVSGSGSFVSTTTTYSSSLSVSMPMKLTPANPSTYLTITATCSADASLNDDFYVTVYSPLVLSAASYSSTVYFRFAISATLGHSSFCSGEQVTLSTSPSVTLHGYSAATPSTSMSFSNIYITSIGTYTLTAECSSSTAFIDTATISILQGTLKVNSVLTGASASVIFI
jgi:hypothetical protein